MVIQLFASVAKDNTLNHQLLLNQYIYYYLEVLHEPTLSNIYLHANKFLNTLHLDQYVDRGVDTNLVVDLENDWNSLNKLRSNDLPFRVRSFLQKSKIMVGRNVWFRHTHNFLYFYLIQDFINRSRDLFPKVHNNLEFFVHRPIVIKAHREYQLKEYLNCSRELEIYYEDMYKDSKEHRLDGFFQTLPLSQDTFSELKASTMWGSRQGLEYLKRNADKWC